MGRTSSIECCGRRVMLLIIGSCRRAGGGWNGGPPPTDGRCGTPLPGRGRRRGLPPAARSRAGRPQPILGGRPSWPRPELTTTASTAGRRRTGPAAKGWACRARIPRRCSKAVVYHARNRPMPAPTGAAQGERPPVGQASPLETATDLLGSFRPGRGGRPGFSDADRLRTGGPSMTELRPWRLVEP